MDRTLALITALALAVPVGAHDLKGASSDEIRARAGAALRARAAELAPTATTRSGALEAIDALANERLAIIDALGEAMRITSMEGILLADAVDDSLAASLRVLCDAYRGANPEPLLNTGAEKFSNAVANLGFVRAHATGFLVHLEMQQSLLILQDFRNRRTETEVEGAEDAFLRHYGMLADLYAAQHESLEDLHASSLANLEWAIGRFETEQGVSNFFVANQFLSYKDEEFSYLLKLQSQDTGEVVDVEYPLPWMTRMDPGWQELQRQKAESARTTGD
jgi:hypothetical protein